MANIKDVANATEEKATKLISDLAKVNTEMQVFTKIVHEGEEDEFIYDYIVVNDVEYRVPKSVLLQLKEHLKQNPSLEFFRVVKAGEGLKSAYTVLPL